MVHRFIGFSLSDYLPWGAQTHVEAVRTSSFASFRKVGFKL